MRRLWFALALLCTPVEAQQMMVPGFPPGVFNDRAALEVKSGSVAPTYSYNFATSGVIDSGNMTFTGSLGTYTNVSGNVVAASTNAARFDYSPTSVGTPIGLLVEESRINSLKQSNGFGTTWVATTATVANTGIIAGIDGTNDAWTLTAASGTSKSPSVYQGSLNATATSSFTIYVKPGTWNYVYMVLQGNTGTNWVTAVFNLTNSSTCTSGPSQTGVGAGSGTLVSATCTLANNGFFRLALTGYAATTPTYVFFGLAYAATGNVLQAASGQMYATYAGTETVILTSAQLEAGAFPTSYIPTTTAAVTRTVDKLQLTGGALATCLGGSAGSVVIKTPDGRAAYAGTLLSENGVVELGETAANKAATSVGTLLTSLNTATWTGPNDTGFSWSTTAGLIDLNATVTSDANSRAPAANFYLGSNAGTSAFWDGHFTSIACYNTYQATPQ